MIKLSNNRICNKRHASLISLQRRISAFEANLLPEGWLWPQIIPVAPTPMAIFRMIRISTEVSEIPPWNICLKVMTLFALSRKRTANISVDENPRSLKCKKASLLVLMTLTFGLAYALLKSSRAAISLLASLCVSPSSHQIGKGGSSEQKRIMRIMGKNIFHLSGRGNQRI